MEQEPTKPIMSDLKFDIYAMVKPTTRADVEALMVEFLNEAQHINDILDEMLNTSHRPTPGN